MKAKNDQIESLQRLLGASKPTQQAEKIEDSISEPIQPPPQPTLEPKPIVQESQPEPLKRRGLFGRVIRAVLD